MQQPDLLEVAVSMARQFHREREQALQVILTESTHALKNKIIECAQKGEWGLEFSPQTMKYTLNKEPWEYNIDFTTICKTLQGWLEQQRMVCEIKDDSVLGVRWGTG